MFCNSKNLQRHAQDCVDELFQHELDAVRYYESIRLTLPEMQSPDRLEKELQHKLDTVQDIADSTQLPYSLPKVPFSDMTEFLQTTSKSSTPNETNRTADQSDKEQNNNELIQFEDEPLMATDAINRCFERDIQKEIPFEPYLLDKPLNPLLPVYRQLKKKEADNENDPAQSLSRIEPPLMSCINRDDIPLAEFSRDLNEAIDLNNFPLKRMKACIDVHKPYEDYTTSHFQKHFAYYFPDSALQLTLLKVPDVQDDNSISKVCLPVFNQKWEDQLNLELEQSVVGFAAGQNIPEYRPPIIRKLLEYYARYSPERTVPSSPGNAKKVITQGDKATAASAVAKFSPPTVQPRVVNRVTTSTSISSLIKLFFSSQRPETEAETLKKRGHELSYQTPLEDALTTSLKSTLWQLKAKFIVPGSETIASLSLERIRTLLLSYQKRIRESMPNYSKTKYKRQSKKRKVDKLQKESLIVADIASAFQGLIWLFVLRRLWDYAKETENVIQKGKEYLEFLHHSSVYEKVLQHSTTIMKDLRVLQNLLNRLSAPKSPKPERPIIPDKNPVQDSKAPIKEIDVSVLSTPVTIICDTNILDNMEIIRMLSSKYNVQLVEREIHMCMDFIVDVESGISICNGTLFESTQDLMDAMHADTSENIIQQYTCKLLELQGQFSNVMILVDFSSWGHDQKVAHGFPVYRKRGVSFFSQYQLKENLVSAFYVALVNIPMNVQVRLCFTVEEKARLIRQYIDSISVQQATKAPYMLPAEWFDRSFLMEEESRHEKFIVSTGLMNSFEAQYMLNVAPLKHWLEISETLDKSDKKYSRIVKVLEFCRRNFAIGASADQCFSMTPASISTSITELSEENEAFKEETQNYSRKNFRL